MLMKFDLILQLFIQVHLLDSSVIYIKELPMDEVSTKIIENDCSHEMVLGPNLISLGVMSFF